MRASIQTIKRLFRMLARTQDSEYSCDDVYRLLDEFAEAVARGEDTTRFMPQVQQHLAMCPDCREELEALLLVLRAQAA